MSNLYVSPLYRRKGIGEELVNEAMFYARMIGFEALNLDTPDALAYYEHRWSVKYIREAAPSMFQDPTHVIQLRT
jgi:GNAT superfamily N-acetyltransferase